ncbi:radical SAM protein [Pedosphaera parvula]|nr:radical SAM protein [Pedosphaera parvula]
MSPIKHQTGREQPESATTSGGSSMEPAMPDKKEKRFQTAFGCSREGLGNRFVYVVISPRARGLSIGINMNPGKDCNFDCAYCEVNRCQRSSEESLDVDIMCVELQKTLELVRSGTIHQQSLFRIAPPGLLKLRHVALSGDGEPTLCPNFSKAVQTVAHIRARSGSFFKMVLITNASGLDSPEVQNGLRYFTRDDEIWAKLDAGSQEYYEKVNQSKVPLEKVLANILFQARQRPLIIQSLFPAINGQAPSPVEIAQYAERLKELKTAGACIPLVQIYSATRPTPHSECGHLPLKILSGIAQTVRETAGLRAEVF